MQVKRKNGLKIAAITIALLLCLALAVGITGAWYQAKRQATGTLSMDQGIIIDYKGFGKTDEGIWSRETTTTFLLFDETNAQPGEEITVNAAGIRANEKSVNFYARVKLTYKFYNVVKSATEGEQDTENVVYDSNATTGNVEGFKPSDLITTSANFFGTNWVESGDGYYYYATGSTLNTFAKTATTFVNLFAADAKFVIEGAGFTGATSDGEGGGFVVGDTSINKIEVYLTLETLQGDATAEQAEALGWKIATGVTEDENVVELTPEDYTSTTTTDDETGEEKTIYTPSETFVGKNPKYAFTFSLNDTDKTATITGPVGKPTELDIPSKLLVNDKSYITKNIGAYAFEQCESLTTINLPNTLTAIKNAAFCLCTGLKSIIIPNGVRDIGDYAFSTASSLLSISLPNTLINIGGAAFGFCTNLKNLDLPENLKSIGQEAFGGSALSSIIIPKSVINIDEGDPEYGTPLFYGCSNLVSIVVEEGNKKYKSVDNCLINIETKTLIAACNGSIIPSDENVITIGKCAYAYTKLKSIVMQKNIIEIKSQAFSYCENLTTKIGEGWVKASDNTAVDANTLLKDIDYDIKRTA